MPPRPGEGDFGEVGEVGESDESDESDEHAEFAEFTKIVEFPGSMSGGISPRIGPRQLQRKSVPATQHAV